MIEFNLASGSKQNRNAKSGKHFFPPALDGGRFLSYLKDGENHSFAPFPGSKWVGVGGGGGRGRQREAPIYPAARFPGFLVASCHLPLKEFCEMTTQHCFILLLYIKKGYWDIFSFFLQGKERDLLTSLIPLEE